MAEPDKPRNVFINKRVIRTYFQTYLLPEFEFEFEFEFFARKDIDRFEPVIILHFHKQKINTEFLISYHYKPTNYL